MMCLKKKGAIEMSIGTIVIIVIALTMLILGIVLVRSIMCSAINLTSETSNAAKTQVDSLFGATGGEIQCIGSSGDQVVMIPGRLNIVYCGVRAPNTKDYVFTTDIDPDQNSREVVDEVKGWMGGKTEVTFEQSIGPGDELAKKIARLDIPNDAPQISFVLSVTVKEKGKTDVISSQQLDFRVSNQGLIRAAMC